MKRYQLAALPLFLVTLTGCASMQAGTAAVEKGVFIAVDSACKSSAFFRQGLLTRINQSTDPNKLDLRCAGDGPTPLGTLKTGVSAEDQADYEAGVAAAEAAVR